MNDYIIKAVVENGIVHYAIYQNGIFKCSEDTKSEALHTIENYLNNN